MIVGYWFQRINVLKCHSGTVNYPLKYTSLWWRNTRCRTKATVNLLIKDSLQEITIKVCVWLIWIGYDCCQNLHPIVVILRSYWYIVEIRLVVVHFKELFCRIKISNSNRTNRHPFPVCTGYCTGCFLKY